MIFTFEVMVERSFRYTDALENFINARYLKPAFGQQLSSAPHQSIARVCSCGHTMAASAVARLNRMGVDF